MEIEAGRVLSGRYRLIRPLGQGSQASVWVAEHLALTTQVAVKLIDPDLAKREDARERFRREATAAAQLRSAHVVQILDHGIDVDQPFIVMELLDGEDLFERLDKRGRLTLRETSRIVTQVARALNRAHAANIVHRDLKPENVFLVTNEDDEVVKVFDFGVAKVIDPTKAVMQRTSVGQLIGTPHYMSPEQVKGTGEVDFKADLWALGVITYQCVTGYLPFDSEGVGDLLIKITIGDIPIPSKTLPGLPAAFDAWFARACHRDAAMRFDTARELAEALARAVRGSQDAPGVASIPRPTAQKPVAPAALLRSTPPPAMPVEVPSFKVPAPPLPRRAEPAPAPPKPAGVKRVATEHLDTDDLEEVMSFDEEPQAPSSVGPSSATEKPKDAIRAMPPGPPSGPMPASRAAPSMPPSSVSGPGSAVKSVPPPLPGASPGAPAAAPSVKSPPSVAPSAPLAGLSASAVLEEPAPAPAAWPDAAPAPAEEVHPPPAAETAEPPAPQAAQSFEPAPAPAAWPDAATAPVLAPAAPLPVAPLAAVAPAISPTLNVDPAPQAPPWPAASSAQPSAPPAPRPVAAPPPPAAPPVQYGAPPPSSVPAFDRSDFSSIDAPPEFDGSRRKRLVRFLAVGLVVAALLITWIVVSSQLPVRNAGPDGAASAPPVLEQPQPPPQPQPTEAPVSSAAVDPIKPAASASAKPAPKKGRPGPPRSKPKDDMTIEIPDVPPE